jgi:hypothetical protein
MYFSPYYYFIESKKSINKWGFFQISSAAVDAEIAEMRSIVETVQEVVKNVVEE